MTPHNEGLGIITTNRDASQGALTGGCWSWAVARRRGIAAARPSVGRRTRTPRRAGRASPSGARDGARPRRRSRRAGAASASCRRRVPLAGRQRGPPRLELEHRPDAHERLARECVFGRDGGLPKVPSRCDQHATSSGAFVARDAGVAAEQRIVDAVRIGQDVSAESPEHLADGVARVPRLVLEKDVVVIGEHDEEVPLGARLPLARGERLGPNRDARGVGREAERLSLWPPRRTRRRCTPSVAPASSA